MHSSSPRSVDRDLDMRGADRTNLRRFTVSCAQQVRVHKSDFVKIAINRRVVPACISLVFGKADEQYPNWGKK